MGPSAGPWDMGEEEGQPSPHLPPRTSPQPLPHVFQLQMGPSPTSPGGDLGPRLSLPLNSTFSGAFWKMRPRGKAKAELAFTTPSLGITYLQPLVHAALVRDLEAGAGKRGLLGSSAHGVPLLLLCSPPLPFPVQLIQLVLS